jgi:dihydroxyacetone kinase phosphotransfer subunit
VISLVIVSHCHQIAEGVKELAMQMTKEPINIISIGGIVDEAGQRQLGTDAVEIAAALHDSWTRDGVLILVDLGSAVLSAETALDLLPEEMQDSCLISNAPLVEGAVVAALEASLGHTLEDVNRASESACHFDKIVR